MVLRYVYACHILCDIAFHHLTMCQYSLNIYRAGSHFIDIVKALPDGLHRYEFLIFGFQNLSGEFYHCF